MAESDQLVEVLKEIRDELRAVRIELGARDVRMSPDGIRTEVVDRGARWRNTALAAGALAGLALVLGLAMRERPAPTTVAVAPPIPAMPAIPAPVVMPAQAPVVPAAPVAARGAVPVTTPAKSPAGVSTPATKPAVRLPAQAPAIASVPILPKKHVKPDVAAKSPAELASDEDETLAFPAPPRRVRVHRLSYGPVGSEPAKL